MTLLAAQSRTLESFCGHFEQIPLPFARNQGRFPRFQRVPGVFGQIAQKGIHPLARDRRKLVDALLLGPGRSASVVLGPIFRVLMSREIDFRPNPPHFGVQTS